MNENKPRLIDLSLDEGRLIKWKIGRETYGPVFVGHPLEQLNDEILDAYNYCEEARRWGYDLGNAEAFLRVMHRRVKDAYQRQDGKRPALSPALSEDDT